MLIAVVGGKLQGVEIAYLAKKAGWETLVIDKNTDTPATGLCDRFLQFEFTLKSPVPPACPNIDFILPALEDIDALTAITKWSKLKGIPLAFDLDAYKISNSKLKSNALFREMNLPLPESWPDCTYPVVVKPDKASGSEKVKLIYDSKELSVKFSDVQKSDNLVIQSFVDGPCFSIEVVGSPGNYQALQITDLGMDNAFDCKEVRAPSRLPADLAAKFREMAVLIAKKINLTGIMDLEVILFDNGLKILEIDARFPSQTPIAVYCSTRFNMVEILGKLLINRENQNIVQADEQYVIIEHIQVSKNRLDVCGEHIMALKGPLTIQKDFFGANEAITDYKSKQKSWVATLILKGESQREVVQKRKKCHGQIIQYSKTL